MDIGRIFEKNSNWVQQKLTEDSHFFERLSKGQSPKILYIGCSDSRVTAEEIMGLSLGDMFVHRNIANVVTGLDLSLMSGIEYAIGHLEVSHIIVCGHYNCGGVKAAMQSADLGILNLWLRNIRDVYRLHKTELDRIHDPEERYARLVELNVEEQCINVIKIASVQEAYLNRKIKVHGWVFDMKTGLLVDLKIDFDNILAKVMDIYRLKAGPTV